jgi:tetratricopeptide (TPR) repeat protein
LSTEKPPSQIELATALIQQGKLTQALDQIINPLINEFEKQYGDCKQKVFCACGPVETLMYLAKAVSEKEPNGAIAADYKYAQAYYLRGYLAIEQKENKPALDNLTKAVELSPFSPQFLCELGNFYQNARDWGRAMELYEQAAANLPMDARGGNTFLQRRTLRGKAFILVELKRLDEAEKLHRRCLEMDPNDDKALRELEYIARLRFAAKEPSQKSSVLSSTDLDDLLRRGVAAGNKQCWKEALVNFDRVLELNPDNGEGWFRRGVALIAIHQFSEAIESFEKANKLGQKESAKLLNYWRSKLRV